MLRTFRIAFSLKNTYRVNAILYAIRQIPLLRRVLPERLYRIRWLKIAANILAAIWEVATVFVGKILYLLLMVAGAGSLYTGVPADGLFVHILFFLTLIGAYMNTYMFNPTNDKYYAMMLLRMDARRFMLSGYIYAMLKVLIGFLPLLLWFGTRWAVPVWLCLLFPLFIVAAKLVFAWQFIAHYQKTGVCTNENLPPKIGWVLTGLLLAAAYGLPCAGLLLPRLVLLPLLLVTLGLAVYAAFQLAAFDGYKDMARQLLADRKTGMDVKATVRRTTEMQNRKYISSAQGITSRKKGFAYLNELFVKRHRRLLWRPAKRVAAIALALVAAVLLVFRLQPAVRPEVNALLMDTLPYFVFILYAINRGASFTQALFVNCDHSLLSYSFYKRPVLILRLFAIRLREIIKVNLLPAAVIGVGLSLLLYASGGTDSPLVYGILPVSILAMSVFFSVHHLTCYYLLQPYTANTELRGGMYRIVMTATYLLCVLFMQLRVNTLLFGLLTIVFCLAYCAVACLLVYKFAARTFRLRN